MSTDLLSAGRATYNEELDSWISKKKATVKLINAVGNLLYDNSVELVLFRNHLVDTSVSEVLLLHKYAADVVGKPISVHETTAVAEALVKMDLAPSKIDVGLLTAEWMEVKNDYDSIESFLSSKLEGFTSFDESGRGPRDVVLYGFGRIGRLAARELIQQFGKGQQLRLKAIVTRKVTDEEIIKRADLLRLDSVHGPFSGTVVPDLKRQAIIINGQIVKMIQAPGPDQVNYEDYGISDAIVLDNTGAFRDRDALSLHLKSKGIAKVILTAPGKGIPNIVYGINHQTLDLDHENIYSAASCTTNAISTVLSVIQKEYGIDKGHIETVHAYTNDQNLLDNFHKKERRGRSAALNMVITETGAGAAVTKVIPELKDKLTANAVRVPVPNGSLAIMNLSLHKETSVEEVNALVKKAALKGDLVNQIHYSIEPELVSSDIVGDTCCSVYDSRATLVHPDKKNVVLYVWYDNEYGYTKQVIRLAKYVAKVRRKHYY
ncbi:glyceraldehyde-3-phosphate dehydrogenase [Cryomorphaceae bacterium 1068]|nr:glyceraldehyde-3-phosphate dehydrogenase [Cryomorphaceae bacterium 1068]